MKKATFFSFIFFILMSLGAMRSYVSFGDNYSGSNGVTCSMCHGDNKDSLSITYWFPSGSCYTAGSTFYYKIQLRDSSQRASFLGTQVATIAKGTANNPDPVTLGLIGASGGFFRSSSINGVEVNTHESPFTLGWYNTYPTNTQGYGTNIVRQYWIHPSAVDTIFHYISAVFTHGDSTMFYDRVISDTLAIPVCNILGFPSADPYDNINNEKNTVNITSKNNWNIWGQHGSGVQAPFEIIYDPEYGLTNQKIRKVVRIP
jgi:hypothetical protein